jgi:small subunit ribosomal protein S3
LIEREFIAQKTKEHYITKYVETKLPKVGISSITLKKIPLGEKIIIRTSRPSLVVGSKGANIKDLTKALKKKFKLENPQVEIIEVKDIFLDAQIVAERIAGSLERFGSARFKGVGHKTMSNVINSGALGMELVISGKIPGSRAKSWRFYQGYLKKCGDVSIEGVRRAQSVALLKTGIIGIKVAIMPPDLDLPDTVEILDEPIQIVEEVEEKKTKKKPTKKKATKKKAVKKKEAVEKVEQEIKEEVKEELKDEGMKDAVAETVAEEIKKSDAVEDVAEEIVEEIKVDDQQSSDTKPKVVEQESAADLVVAATQDSVEEPTSDTNNTDIIKEGKS